MARALIDQPVLMAQKKTWHLYSLADRFIPHLTEWHKFAPNLSWCPFDRGFLDPWYRLLRRRHAHQNSLIANEQVAKMERLLDWDECSACADHDIQNGLRWGCCKGNADPKSIMKRVFKAVRSIRDSLDRFVSTVNDWVKEVCEFDEEPFDEEEVYQIWLWVGMPEKLARRLAKVNLRWLNGKLRVHPKVFTEGADPFYVDALVLAVYRVYTFSDTRFLGMGASCQGVVGAIMVGLDSHVRYCREQTETGEYYIKHYDDLTPEARLFIGKAAVVSHITNPLHKLLLKDDRVGKDPQRYISTLFDAVGNVCSNVPRLLFERLAEHIPGVSAQEVESKTFLAVYGAASFSDRRFCSRARSPLFNYTHGDIAEKLEALKASEDEPKQKTLWKARELLKMGYPPAPIKEQFENMSEAPWTIIRYEHLHASGSVQHKAHPGFGPDSLSAKAGLHQMRPLVRVGAPIVRRTMDSIRLASLKKKPEKATAQGLFLGEAVSVALAALSPLAGKRCRRTNTRKVVKTHSKAYKKLPHAVKDRYERALVTHKAKSRSLG